MSHLDFIQWIVSAFLIRSELSLSRTPVYNLNRDRSNSECKIIFCSISPEEYPPKIHIKFSNKRQYRIFNSDNTLQKKNANVP